MSFSEPFRKTLNSLYFTPYNNKVWRQDISQIAMDWLEDKLPMPSVAEILLNNIGHINESAMVHSSFFYAKTAVPSFWRIRWLAASRSGIGRKL